MGHWRGPRVYDCLMLARDSGWGANYRDPPEIENPLYRCLMLFRSSGWYPEGS